MNAELPLTRYSRNFILTSTFANLKIHLHGELNLTRRSGFTGGKSRACDLAKGRSSDHGSRWAKVGMIENVEEFSSKLRAKSFAECDVFDYGKISVTKARSDHDIATEATETRHRPEHRSIEPLINAADRCNRSGHVRTRSISDTIHSAVAGDDVDGTAALYLNDR